MAKRWVPFFGKTRKHWMRRKAFGNVWGYDAFLEGRVVQLGTKAIQYLSSETQTTKFFTDVCISKDASGKYL
jgi:hypothetical protein